jgi:AcrR family transcriptional regulator
LPRGPQALPREEVHADQRRRLFEAMIQLLNERGLAGVRISELVARAGISRRSFYEHFHNKEECLLAAFDESAERLERRMIAAYDPKADTRSQVRALVGALFDATVERPAAARLVCVDISAAGAEGVARWAAGAARFELALSIVFARANGEGTLPQPVTKAVVGALRKIVYARALTAASPRALRAQLSRVLDDLVDWVTAYYPSPANVPVAPPPMPATQQAASAEDAGARSAGRRSAGTRSAGTKSAGTRSAGTKSAGAQRNGHRRAGAQPADGQAAGQAAGPPLRPSRRLGGRAPGSLVTLYPGGLPGLQRGLPTGDHNLPRGFVEHNQRERIFDAIANLTAAHGYPALGLEDIAAQAAISLQTFYGHFESKEEAFIATYEVGHGRAQTICAEAFAAQRDWIAGVRAGVAALLEFLAAEPAYAHLACVDIVLAFPRPAERMQRGSYSYAELLDFGIASYRGASGERARERGTGNERTGEGRANEKGAGSERTGRRSAGAHDNEALPPGVVSEAIVGGVFELMYDYVARGLTERLPELTGHATYIALTPFIGAKRAAQAAFPS